MPSDAITDHVTRAIERLPRYIQEEPNWVGLITALTSEIQFLEDTFDDLLNQQHLSVAVGAQLDIIGEILDKPREGLNDDAYRAVLQNQAVVLAGSGEGETVIAAYKDLLSAYKVILTEYQPATVELAAFMTAGGDTTTPAEDAAIFLAVLEIRIAGVDLSLLVVEDNAFIWGDSADADANGDLPIDADHGWGDSADADANGDITPGAGNGGNFARVIQ